MAAIEAAVTHYPNVENTGIAVEPYLAGVSRKLIDSTPEAIVLFHSRPAGRARLKGEDYQRN